MKTVLGLLLFIWLDIPAFAGYKPIGFKTSTLSDRQTDRPLELVVWYPSTTIAPPQLIADSPVFSGDLAVRDAPPTAGTYPLVVFSHGFRGNWGNQSWLASALAHQGYIVAAVNHPGTTTRDRNPEAAAQLWRRPIDLQRAINAVMARSWNLLTLPSVCLRRRVVMSRSRTPAISASCRRANQARWRCSKTMLQGMVSFAGTAITPGRGGRSSCRSPRW